MLCPACGAIDNKVIDSRLTEGGLAIRRRRTCVVCKRRFTTKERLERELRLTVIKSGGQRVPYNRDNILSGVERACGKLGIRDDQLQELVDRVEEDLFGNHERDVSTEQIGQYVSGHLRRANEVAYVRFMSVYRKFRTVDEFVDEIRDIRARNAEDSPNQQSLFG